MLLVLVLVPMLVLVLVVDQVLAMDSPKVWSGSRSSIYPSQPP